MMQFVMSQDKTSITPPEAGLQLVLLYKSEHLSQEKVKCSFVLTLIKNTVTQYDIKLMLNED